MNPTFLEALAERNRDGVLLLARILLAAIFVQSGFGKLSHFAAFADSLAGKGLPLPFLWALAAVAAEFLGSLCILFGLAARPIAALMVVFVAFAAVLGHPFWAANPASYRGQYTNFMKDAAIMGGYLALFIGGPGSISLDGWLRCRG
jgi:putative oxidoreductase